MVVVLAMAAAVDVPGVLGDSRSRIFFGNSCWWSADAIIDSSEACGHLLPVTYLI